MHYALYDATGTSLGPVAILPPLEESKAVAHVPPVESIGSENSGGTLTESGGHMTPEVVAVLPKVVAILPPEPNSEPIREHNSERKGGPIESMGNNHSPKIIRKMVGAEIIEYEREDFEVPGLEQVLDFDATLEDKTDVADSNHAEYWWEAKEKTQWMAGGKRIRDWRATYLGFLLKVDGDRCGVMA